MPVFRCRFVSLRRCRTCFFSDVEGISQEYMLWLKKMVVTSSETFIFWFRDAVRVLRCRCLGLSRCQADSEV